MRVEQSPAQPDKVAVLRIVDLDQAPWIASSADDFSSPNVDFFLASDNRERQKRLLM